MSWPAYNRVEHVQPTSSVVVDVSRFSRDQAIITLSTEGVVDAQFTSINGVITIPNEAIETAVADRKMISLSIGSNTIGGYILFLRSVESEPFSQQRIMYVDGRRIPTDLPYYCTDMVDVTYATDIVLTARFRAGATGELSMLNAYDENQEFVRVLVPVNTDNPPKTYHVVPDGTYKYVVACATDESDHSLELHFPDRRKKAKKDKIIQDSDEKEDP